MFKNKRLFYLVSASMLVLVTGGSLAYWPIINNNGINHNKAAQPLRHSEFEITKNKLLQLLEQKDPRASQDYLRSAIKKDANLARTCHPLLHQLGHAAYEKYRDFNKAINYQNSLCNSGYTHGVIEAHFQASDNIQTALQTTCSRQESQVTFQQWQCYHGIGHGLMYFTGKDLPRSLSLCEDLNIDIARSSCVNGVFMERFIIISHSGSTDPNASDINLDLCSRQAVAHKPDCYIYAPSAYLERFTNNYSGAFDHCNNAEVEFIDTCIYGVGGQAMKENITRPDTAKNICLAAPKKRVSSCIEGAVSLLINYNGSTAGVKPLCDTVFNKYRGLCTEKVEYWNSLFAT